MTKSDKENKMTKAYEMGFKFEREYGNCSQCVFAAVSDVRGKSNDEIFKAIDGLAGGVGRSTNGTCGALSGGVVAISLSYGRQAFSNPGQKEKCAKLAKKLHDRFIEEYGSVLCKDIQTKIMGRSYDMWDPKDRQEFDKAGGHTDKCPDVVGKAARWVVEMLMDKT
jgi:C_GCAxxG_C_C family probable redox protein